MGEHNSTPVDEGRKSCNLLAIKMQGTNRSVEGGERACYVTPDLRYDYVGGREKKEGEDNKWYGKKQKTKNKNKIRHEGFEYTW